MNAGAIGFTGASFRAREDRGEFDRGVHDERAAVREIPKQFRTSVIHQVEIAHVDQQSLPGRQVMAADVEDPADVRPTERAAQPHGDAWTHAAVSANVHARYR